MITIIPAQPGWFVSYQMNSKSYSCPVVAWMQVNPTKLIPMVVGSNCDDVVPVTQSAIEGSYSLLAPHEAYEYCTTSGMPEKHGPEGDWEAIGFSTDSGEDSALYTLWRRPHGG